MRLNYSIKNDVVSIYFKINKNIGYLLQKCVVVPRAGFERAQNGDDTKEFPFFVQF